MQTKLDIVLRNAYMRGDVFHTPVPILILSQLYILKIESTGLISWVRITIMTCHLFVDAFSNEYIHAAVNLGTAKAS